MPHGAAAPQPADGAPGRAGAPGGRRRCHRRPADARHLQAFPEKGTSVKITEKEVRYVAGLANLTLTDAEIAKLQADLDGILEHMDRLKEVDPSGANPRRRCFSRPVKRPPCAPTCRCLR